MNVPSKTEKLKKHKNKLADRRTIKSSSYKREGDEHFFLDENEDELLRMSRDEVIKDLTEKERKFCEYYTHNFNIKVAAIKAGYSAHSANIVGWRVRQNYRVNRYICWLKVRLSKRLFVSAMDVIDQYAKIAFADITDFVETTERGFLKLKDLDAIDGQIIKTIKQGRYGLEIELEDRMRALEKIEKYFDVMPADWRQKIEERKLAILEERLKLDKVKMGEDGDFEDDGFFNALKTAAKEIWE